MVFSSIEQAVKDLQRGHFIIVVDDEHRENEGDLLIAAEHCTPMRINFMLKNARGLICAPITKQRASELKLNLMVPDNENTEVTQCKFTVSVDAKKGITTGISAKDRSVTVRSLADSATKASQFSKPGHIFPLVAEDRGVLAREGHTEAAVDLCKLAKLKPVGIICEILNDDGDAAKLEELEAFSEKHGFSLISIADLISYRRNHG